MDGSQSLGSIGTAAATDMARMGAGWLTLPLVEAYPFTAGGTCEADLMVSFIMNLRGGLFGRAVRANIGISVRFDLF